jgi:hypothetical protein
MPRSSYLCAVKELTAQHFAASPHQPTCFEVELGVFCCLVQTLDGVQQDRAHRDRVLEAVQQFIFRLRAGHVGALTLVLQRLEQLESERRSTPI